MGGSARRWISLGLIALAAAGACGGNDTPAPAGATVPREAPTTTAADQYAVPATIDAAYLNRVFVALDAVDNTATRIIVQSKGLPPEAAKHLISIYAQGELEAQTSRWLELIDEGLVGFRREPQGQRTQVTKVLAASPSCVFVEVVRDSSGNSVGARSPHQYFVHLAPLDQVRNASGFNRTPWMIAGEGFNSDGSVPDSPC